MELSLEQKQSLRKDGFVRLPKAVPAPLIDAALRVINASIGQGMDSANMTAYRVQSFCPELRETPPILALAGPPWPLVLSATGPLKPARRGQIALRFPSMIDEKPKPPGAHLDGVPSANNGVEDGTLFHFTALLGVLLSPLPRENGGNFTVWPGTHEKFAAFFRQHGPQRLIEGTPRVAMPPPVQFTGEPGDAILAHYLLGHGVAPNTSPHPRYMVFFRLFGANHERHGTATMCDPWLEWEGMRTPAAAPAAS